MDHSQAKGRECFFFPRQRTSFEPKIGSDLESKRPKGVLLKAEEGTSFVVLWLVLESNGKPVSFGPLHPLGNRRLV